MIDHPNDPGTPPALELAEAVEVYRATVRTYVLAGEQMLDVAILTGDAIPFLHGCLTLIYLAGLRGVLPSNETHTEAMDVACAAFAQEIFAERQPTAASSADTKEQS